MSMAILFKCNFLKEIQQNDEKINFNMKGGPLL